MYASVKPGYAIDVEPEDFRRVPDATRWDRFRFLWMIIKVALLVVRTRPDIIISTGAAPGYVALRVGKFIGARTIWLDSIANSERISLSGEKIAKHADLWLTQWEHLQKAGGPTYSGSVV